MHDPFDERAEINAAAMRRCPDVRLREREILLEYLDPRAGELVLELQAGLGFLSDALEAAFARPICVDSSRVHVAHARHPRACASPEVLPFGDGAFDAVCGIVPLHHHDGAAILAEARRVLRPGGRIAIAEVAAGSPPARFLNIAVDRWTDTGHKGRFVRRGQLGAQLHALGFLEVVEDLHNFVWGPFASAAEIVGYVKDLFGMVKATDEVVADELTQHIGMLTDGQYALPWMLVYCRGVKA